ncbi:hypothetical protein [Cupriavidus lacunae]|nr:hypothetical protein [Cupriavidus lacunae]
MTVQVGQISNPDGNSVSSRLIENQLTAADRYNLPSSRLKVLNEMGLPPADTDDKASRLIFNSLLGTPAKSPNLLTLQVTAYSRQQAMTALETSFKLLATEHRKLFDPAIGRMNGDLSAISDKLKSAERDYTNSFAWLESNAKQSNDANGRTRELQLTNMTMLADKQVIELRQRSSQLQDALDPTRSFPTRILGDIFAPMRPSTPGWLTYFAGGIVFGIALGSLVIVARKTTRN